MAAGGGNADTRRILPLLLPLLLGLTGCNLVWEYEMPPELDAAPLRPDQAPDLQQAEGLTQPDLGGDLEVDRPLSCSATGLAADCDPYEPSSCSEGQCYLVNRSALGIIGPACVCPEGGLSQNEVCQTTTDCASGLVCANVGPPARCRPLCVPFVEDDDCAGEADCVPVIGLDGFGYCASCSEQGRLRACDPMTGGGCSEGSCYLLRTQEGHHRSMCVCPPGENAADGYCDKTQQCLPGLICVEQINKCRPLCFSDTDCADNTSCQWYGSSWGFCTRWSRW